MSVSTLKQFENAVLKHLQGQHNQKRHGYRYGSVQAARRSMAGTKDPAERAEYRKRAGMPEPKKRAKVEDVPKEKVSISRQERVERQVRSEMNPTDPGRFEWANREILARLRKPDVDAISGTGSQKGKRFTDEPASQKQTDYLRSLVNETNYAYETGKLKRDFPYFQVASNVTKREATLLIDFFKSNPNYRKALSKTVQEIKNQYTEKDGKRFIKDLPKALRATSMYDFVSENMELFG